MSRDTGANIYDLEHLRNSLKDILSTPKGSRVELRSYGSDLYQLIDRPVNSSLVMHMRQTIFEAVEKWEPRIAIDKVILNLDEINLGKVGVILEGWYLLENRPLRLDGITLDFFRHNPYALEHVEFNGEGSRLADRCSKDAAKPMDIAFLGDCGQYNAIQVKTAALIDSWNPDLFLMVGDLTYSLNPKDIEKNTRVFQHWIGSHKALAVAGNHDLDVANGIYHWKKYYYTGRYWSKHYPTHNLHIIGVNAGYKTNGQMIEPDGNTEDSIQGQWIKAEIDKYKAGHVIVLVHYPFATGVTSGTAETKPALAWLKYLPVSTIIAGHTHNGEHYRYLVDTNVYGLDYINVSASSHSVRPMSSSGTTYGAYADLVKQWQYAPNGRSGPPILGRMLVYPDRIDYRVHNVNTGDLMHSFTRSAIHANAT